MSYIHDIIKIKYSKLGYLPDYPYHLISDKEMFSAFIWLLYDKDNETEETTAEEASTVHFFNDTYPNPFDPNNLVYRKLDSEGHVLIEQNLSTVYKTLKQFIVDAINAYLDKSVEIPDWIYTFMLGEVVYEHSEYLDIHDTLVLLGLDNIDNKFTPEACAKCYNTSLKYVSKLPLGSRPPTVFGEPHVIKQLRLEA